MTAPAEDHTGEDQFGPFIVEHNEVIRKKTINELLGWLRNYIGSHQEEGGCPFDSMNEGNCHEYEGSCDLCIFDHAVAELHQQEQS